MGDTMAILMEMMKSQQKLAETQAAQQADMQTKMAEQGKVIETIMEKMETIDQGAPAEAPATGGSAPGPAGGDGPGPTKESAAAQPTAAAAAAQSAVAASTTTSISAPDQSALAATPPTSKPVPAPPSPESLDACDKCVSGSKKPKGHPGKHSKRVGGDITNVTAEPKRPKKTKSVPGNKYIKLGDLKEHFPDNSRAIVKVCVFALVEKVSEQKQCNRGSNDYMSCVWLRDGSETRSLTVPFNVFERSVLDRLPPDEKDCKGMVIRIHRAQLKQWSERPQLSGNHKFGMSWCIFEGPDAKEDDFEITKWRNSPNPSPADDAQKAVIRELRALASAEASALATEVSLLGANDTGADGLATVVGQVVAIRGVKIENMAAPVGEKLDKLDKSQWATTLGGAGAGGAPSEYELALWDGSACPDGRRQNPSLAEQVALGTTVVSVVLNAEDVVIGLGEGGLNKGDWVRVAGVECLKAPRPGRSETAALFGKYGVSSLQVLPSSDAAVEAVVGHDRWLRKDMWESISPKLAVCLPSAIHGRPEVAEKLREKFPLTPLAKAKPDELADPVCRILGRVVDTTAAADCCVQHPDGQWAWQIKLTVADVSGTVDVLSCPQTAAIDTGEDLPLFADVAPGDLKNNSATRQKVEGLLNGIKGQWCEMLVVVFKAHGVEPFLVTRWTQAVIRDQD